MRLLLYLFIVVALAARGGLFLFFAAWKRQRRDDAYFGAIFLSFAASYLLYAAEAAHREMVIPAETAIDVLLGVVVVCTTIRAFLSAVKDKNKRP